jgi:hypothetical protein
MNSGSLVRYTWLWATVACLSFAPVKASHFSFVPDPADCNPDGQCSCPPDTDCSDDEAGGGWNPTFICPFGAADTLGSLLECLADGYDSQGPSCPPVTSENPSTTIDDSGLPQDLQQNPPSPDDCNDPMSREDYLVSPLPVPQWGIKIVRLNGTETDRLMAWENIAGVLGINIRVMRDGLVARIARFTQKPSRSGGIITVSVNGYAVNLNTGLHKSADSLSDSLAAIYNQAGFKAVSHGEYLYIIGAPLSLGEITDLSMVSTDREITNTDLALLPLQETGILLSEGSPQILGEPLPTVPSIR